MAELYRHFDQLGQLLYVGISVSALRRLAQHRTGAAWFPAIARVEVEHFPTRADAERAEVEAIKKERPKHNITHSTPRPSPAPKPKTAPPAKTQLTPASIAKLILETRKTPGFKRQVFTDVAPGLLLVVGRRTASWTLRFRPRGLNPDGSRPSPNVFVIGDVALVSPHKARAKAATLRAKIVQGAHPAREKAAKRRGTDRHRDLRSADIRALNPPSTRRMLEVHDKREPGLTLRLSSKARNGIRKRAWTWRYRDSAGKHRRIILGHWPSVDYEDAVRKLGEARQAHSAGVDLMTAPRNAASPQRSCPDKDAASGSPTS